MTEILFIIFLREQIYKREYGLILNILFGLTFSCLGVANDQLLRIREHDKCHCQIKNL